MQYGSATRNSPIGRNDNPEWAKPLTRVRGPGFPPALRDTRDTRDAPSLKRKWPPSKKGGHSSVGQKLR